MRRPTSVGRRQVGRLGKLATKGQNESVKWFNGEKGYVFIAPESGSDPYVHSGATVGNGFKSLKVGRSSPVKPFRGTRRGCGSKAAAGVGAPLGRRRARSRVG
ncbi:cold shock domain-containing protein [Streptomyces sp. NPDC020883]|uniref:cold shock domain-containing protein n=1 Tax=Streptomyces sp. NPDC020883 TaxID=3365099 RepID=UPI0037A616A4